MLPGPSAPYVVPQVPRPRDGAGRGDTTRCTAYRSSDARREPFAGTVQITAVEAIPFAVPYRRAPTFASGSVSSRGQRARASAHATLGSSVRRRRSRGPYTYGETQVVDRRRRRRAAQRGARRASTRCASSWSPSAAARSPGNYVARGAVDLAVWDLVGADPRLPVPHPAGRVRGRRRGRAHGLARRAGGDGRRGGRGATSGSGSRRSRSRSGALRRWTSPRCARSATPCRTPTSTSTPIAAGATTTPCGPGTRSPSSACARSRSRSRSRTGPAGYGSPTAGSCRWAATRAASASPTSTARSRRVRSAS